MKLNFAAGFGQHKLIPLSWLGVRRVIPNSEFENIYLSLRMLFGEGDYPYGEEGKYEERVIYDTRVAFDFTLSQTPYLGRFEVL